MLVLVRRRRLGKRVFGSPGTVGGGICRGTKCFKGEMFFGWCDCGGKMQRRDLPARVDYATGRVSYVWGETT